MLRWMLPAAVLWTAASMPLVAGDAIISELKPVKVDLPESDRIFPGPGADAINNNCLACHSAGMVLNQPELSRQIWTAEVDKMIGVYKAPVAAEDVGPIVDYLASRKGVQ
jgi:hypothetical protein